MGRADRIERTPPRSAPTRWAPGLLRSTPRRAYKVVCVAGHLALLSPTRGGKAAPTYARRLPSAVCCMRYRAQCAACATERSALHEGQRHRGESKRTDRPAWTPVRSRSCSPVRSANDVGLLGSPTSRCSPDLDKLSRRCAHLDGALRQASRRPQLPAEARTQDGGCRAMTAEPSSDTGRIVVGFDGSAVLARRPLVGGPPGRADRQRASRS